MTNIVSITNGQLLTTSTAIAEGIGNPHKAVIQLIRNNENDLREFGPLAFEMRKGKPLPQGGFGKSTEYALLNEQQATLLLTYMRNNILVKQFKKRLVKAFFEMRDQLSRENTPKSFAEALRLAADQAEHLERLQNKVKTDAPKVEFAEAVNDAINCVTVQDFAKTMKTGQNRFYSQLRQDGYLQKRNGQKNKPYQQYIEQGLFKLIESHYRDKRSGELMTYFRTVITGKGQLYFQQKYFPVMQVAS